MALLARDAVDAALDRGEAGAGVLQEHFAEVGDADAAAVALDQRGADRRLELAQRLGDRRLADMQHLGGAADALLAGDLDKRAQMAEFDRNVGQIE